MKGCAPISEIAHIKMNRYIPERINKIEEYTPSEGVYSIRLDANENPYKTDLNELLCDGLSSIDIDRYPDPFATALRSEFGKCFSLNPECVAAGNGSDELIGVIVNLFLEKGDTLAVTKPDFSMYSFYASLSGAKVVSEQKSGDMGIDFASLRDLVNESGAKLVMFSNPCNPTGLAYDREVILDFVRSVDCMVVVDEAYMEFCRDGCSVIDECEKLDNLIVLKTLSKAYCSAAARVGFAVSNTDVIKAIMKVKSPYNLNSISQLLGTKMLRNYPKGYKCDTVVADTKELYEKFLSLEKEGGYKALATDANFVLLSFEKEGIAEYIYTELKKRSIIIRMPDKLHLRISCGRSDENEVFKKAFESIVCSAKGEK